MGTRGGDEASMLERPGPPATASGGRGAVKKLAVGSQNGARIYGCCVRLGHSAVQVQWMCHVMCGGWAGGENANARLTARALPRGEAHGVHGEGRGGGSSAQVKGMSSANCN
uniref:Uncharacterized protein n=1 Tax=Oryza meridionalis TaxID=40149 RepID=A0A0E0CHY5_9ORYZ